MIFTKKIACRVFCLKGVRNSILALSMLSFGFSEAWPLAKEVDKPLDKQLSKPLPKPLSIPFLKPFREGFAYSLQKPLNESLRQSLNEPLASLLKTSVGIDSRSLDQRSSVGSVPKELAHDYINMMILASSLKDDAKIEVVNSFFNRRVVYLKDIFAWGVEDYWATPIELLSKGVGDCEDYAIAKYLSLRMLGVGEDKMSISYVRVGGPGIDEASMEPHMVVFFDPNYGSQSNPMVLDNFNSSIKRLSERSDVAAIFRFNESSLWSAMPEKLLGQSKPRLEKWRDVLSRAEVEGFKLTH